MSGTIEIVDEGIYTIPDVMAAEECRELIARAEAIGFSAASVKTSTGERMMTNIRNNDRVNLHDVELASTMWQRVSRLLPVLDSCKPVSVDPNLRFYMSLIRNRRQAHQIHRRCHGELSSRPYSHGR